MTRRIGWGMALAGVVSAAGLASGAAQVSAPARRAAPQVQAGGAGLSLPPTLIRPMVHAPEGNDAQRRAELSLDEALERLHAGAPERPEGAGDLPPEAVKAYARGRERWLAGEHAAALEDLRRASRLAPEAARVWRALGEALVQSGERAEGMEALARAVDLGLEQPNTLLALAVEARAQGRAERAASLLARARAAGPRRYDAALAPLVSAELGRTLVELGYLRAGVTALREGLGPLAISGARTMFAPQLRRFLRQRGELWLMVGDAEAELGLVDEALGAWDRAAEHELPPARSVLARRVRLLVDAGRAEDAAAALAEAAAGPAQRLDERVVLLTRALREAAGPSRAIAAAAREAAGDASRSPSERVWLERVRAAALDREGAAAVLEDAFGRWRDALLLVDLLALAPAGDAEALAGAAVEALEAHPAAAEAVAEALVVQSDDFEGTLEALGERDGGAARLLEALLRSRRGEHAEALELLEGLADRAALEPGASEAEAVLAARAGERARQEAALSRLLAAGGWEHALARVRALREAQRFEEADRLATRALERRGLRAPARRALLLERARIAALREDERSRIDTLRAVLEVDPHFQPAARALLESLDADDPRLTRLRQRLGEEMRHSRLTRLLAAQQEIAQGDRAEAEAQLAQLAVESVAPDEALELLVGLWRREGEGGFSARRGLAWLDRHLGDRTHLARVARARAGLLEASGRDEEAREALAAALPARGLASAAGPEAIVRRAVERARAGELADAAAALEELGEGVELTGAQGERVLRAARATLRGSAEEPTGPQREATLALFDALAPRLAAMPRPMHELRLALLATLEPAPAGRIERALERAIASGAEGGRLAVLPVLHLVQGGRGEEALGLLERLRRVEGVEGAQVLEASLRVVAVAGEREDLRRLLERQRDPAALRQAMAELFGAGEEVGGAADGSTLDALRAEVAHSVASAAIALGREDSGLEMYRVALRFDPSHAWAANNLGYSLLERGVRLEEAEELIERAYRRRPDSASIVDSLGWVRYMRGELRDSDDGGERREGAVTLLRRAVELAEGEDEVSPTLLEHLGDALWRIDEAEEARRAWERGLERARADLERLEGASAGESSFARERREQIERLEARLGALRDGERPPVAKIIETTATRGG